MPCSHRHLSPEDVENCLQMGCQILQEQAMHQPKINYNMHWVFRLRVKRRIYCNASTTTSMATMNYVVIHVTQVSLVGLEVDTNYMMRILLKMGLSLSQRRQQVHSSPPLLSNICCLTRPTCKIQSDLQHFIPSHYSFTHIQTCIVPYPPCLLFFLRVTHISILLPMLSPTNFVHRTSINVYIHIPSTYSLSQ